MNSNMRILIVDDQPRTRLSLSALLATWPRTGEVREATNGREAVEYAETWHPDVVLMDARMPEMDGIAAMRAIKARWPRIRVVVLSMYADYEAEATAAGADGFVSKGEPPQRLLAALTAVVRGAAS
jgi:DNA-binding NarL/FixJ family response regulator